MKYSLAVGALVGFFSAEEVNAIKLEKDLFHELHLRDIGGVTKTWERGTTNMVKDDMKVLPIDREMPNEPAKSRAAW